MRGKLIRSGSFQPGEVRNPNGSSNKQRLTNALIAFLEGKDISDLPPRIRRFVQSGYKQATQEADIGYWKEIIARVDGKIPDPEPPAPPIDMETLARRNKEKRAKRGK